MINKASNHLWRFPLRLLFVGTVLIATSGLSVCWSATGEQYAVATVNPTATEAAMGVYRDGGNAVDAAIAAALTLSVVDNHNSGIGGGCLILIRTPEGQLIAIDGRETAPAAIRAEMYLRNGKADTKLSQNGALASGTPGALAAYQDALDACGSMPLARLLQPGITAAEQGVPLDRIYARNVRKYSAALKRYNGPDDPRFKSDGSPLEQGDLLKQPALGRTYRQLAKHGIDWFYRGEFAQRTEQWMRDNGGVLSAKDFANYQAKRRTPIQTSFAGHTVVGFPPPSSGGIHIAQLLQILEQLDLPAIHARDRATAVHVVAEGMKLVFADRAFWLGDSDYAKVPRGLMAKTYTDQLAKRISLDRVTPVPKHGTPSGWRSDLFGRHTTHIAAADAKGYWVAITATVNTSFGSKVIVPGTGVFLNNEMDDFSLQPGVPNAFGLVGAANNAVQPGKRPLSSMSPTIVLDAQGDPVLTVGAAGGPKIITQVALAVIRNIGLKQPLGDAVAGPRFHHQWRPAQLMVEKGMSSDLVESLRLRGHKIKFLSSGGVTQAIGRTDQGKLAAYHDPRVPGKAMAE